MVATIDIFRGLGKGYGYESGHWAHLSGLHCKLLGLGIPPKPSAEPFQSDVRGFENTAGLDEVRPGQNRARRSR
jgi:hypothetical protein